VECGRKDVSNWGEAVNTWLSMGEVGLAETVCGMLGGRMGEDVNNWGEAVNTWLRMGEVRLAETVCGMLEGRWGRM
jgi:hypothetical protein